MRDSDLLIGIENSAAYVAEEMGAEEVKWVLTKYDAKCIEDLSPSDYEEVFGELFQREADLRSD